MIKRSNNSAKAVAQFFVCLLLLLSVSLSCTLPRKFWRSYEPQPFDVQKWQSADAQERGTMFVDLYKKRLVHGKSKEEVLVLLGEPDKKSTGAGSEIWHYKVEFAGEMPVQYFPVTFDKNGRAGIGTARTDF
jgi:hypothetical protein